MIRNLIFATILLFSCLLASSAQDSTRYFSIGLIPTYYFDPITPSIGLSLEHSLSKKLNVEIMYGYDPNWRFLNWHPDPSSRHHEYKLRLIYVFRGKYENEFIPYLGADYFGNYNKYQRENDLYYEDNILYAFNNAEILRKVDGLRFNLGVKVRMFNRFWIDFFAGAGIRSVLIEYDAPHKQESTVFIFDEWVVPFDRRASRKMKPAIICGLKIAYRMY